MSEDEARLICNLGAAIHGAKPNDVVSVLVSFTQVLLERYGVGMDQYVSALRDQAPPPCATRMAPNVG